MELFRKIKIFKFSDYETYEQCQEAVNDYFALVLKKCLSCGNKNPLINFTVDYIVVILPELEKFNIAKVSKIDNESLTL